MEIVASIRWVFDDEKRLIKSYLALSGQQICIGQWFMSGSIST